MWPIALKICTESSSEYVVKWPKALTARACATMLKVYVTTNPLLLCTPRSPTHIIHVVFAVITDSVHCTQLD